VQNVGTTIPPQPRLLTGYPSVTDGSWHITEVTFTRFDDGPTYSATGTVPATLYYSGEGQGHFTLGIQDPENSLFLELPAPRSQTHPLYTWVSDYYAGQLPINYPFFFEQSLSTWWFPNSAGPRGLTIKFWKIGPPLSFTPSS